MSKSVFSVNVIYCAILQIAVAACRTVHHMLEKVLQDKMVEVIKADQLLQFIINKEVVSDPLRGDEDDHFIPDFQIDSLLRRRYAESAGRVLKSLDCYELVTGENILSISLKTGDSLNPDLILFNPVLNQVILIENKMSKDAEREGMTELLGFANEIRNHLPFVSNLDINYIMVSPEFRPLLDHSVSAQLLGGHINILCLKPIVAGDEITGLAIHYPSAWTDLGQNGLPADALVSYTMCLYPKKPLSQEVVQEIKKEVAEVADEQPEAALTAVEGLPDDDDDVEEERWTLEMQRAVKLAADLINHEANNFHANGFSLVWVNGFDQYPGGCLAAISVYILNPFAFLPDAASKGFVLRKENPLYKYLLDLHEKNGGFLFPSSMFSFAEKAEGHLKKYFDVRWERLTTWDADLADTQYAMQRQPVLFHSFGVIGDFIRYFYLHPAVQKHWLVTLEKTEAGYDTPIVAAQFVNLRAGDVLFRDGDFSPKDVFLFGKYMGLHLQAQLNGSKFKDSESLQYDAMLFWTALPLIQALKEIKMRLNDAKDIVTDGSALPVAISRESIQPGFEAAFEAFFNWFAIEFLDHENQEIFSSLFELGYKSAAYFDPHLTNLYPKEHRPVLEKDLASFARFVLGGVGMGIVEKELVDGDVKKSVNETFFDNKLETLTADDVDAYLHDSVKDQVFLENFEEVLLPVLNVVTGNLIHELRPYEFQYTTDWQWMYETAQKRFKEGKTATVIFVGANGQLSLGQLDGELGMSLSDPEEVFISGQIYASGISQVFRVKWETLRNRTFRFADLINKETADPNKLEGGDIVKGLKSDENDKVAGA